MFIIDDTDVYLTSTGVLMLGLSHRHALTIVRIIRSIRELVELYTEYMMTVINISLPPVWLTKTARLFPGAVGKYMAALVLMVTWKIKGFDFGKYRNLRITAD